MTTELIETGKSPHVTLTKCGGNCTITGWNRSAVELKGEAVSASMPEYGHLLAESGSDLTMMVPSGAAIVLEQVTGNVTVKHVQGHLSLREGGGAIVLSDMGSVIVNKARGDVTGENVDGPLTLLEVSGQVELTRVGNLQVRSAQQGMTANFVAGYVDVGEVAGDLRLHTVSGDLSVAACGADILLSNLGGVTKLEEIVGIARLEGGLSTGDHTIRAAGDIIVRWPYGAPLTLTAGGEIVRCLLPLEARSETITDSRMIIAGHIEDGRAVLSLDSAQKIGILPIAAAGGDAPAETDFAFEFEAEPAPVPAPSGPAAAVESGAEIDLQTKITASLQTYLEQAELHIEPDELSHLVASAFAAALPTAAAEPDIAPTPAPPSAVQTAGSRQAEEAIRAVEQSLDKAEESIETARQKVQPSPEQITPPRQTPTPPAKSVEAASGKPEPPVQAPAERFVTEQQLHILNLLKAGHITVAQADTLLKALIS